MANANPTITSPGSASGRAGVVFSFTIVASGATRFSASNLPPGLTLNPTTGAITGTPTVAGSYTVPVSAYSDTGWTDSQLALTISA